MFGFLFKKIFGSTNDRYLRKLRPLVQRINELEPEMQQLEDADFPIRIAQYRQEVQDGVSGLPPEKFWVCNVWPRAAENSADLAAAAY